MVRGLRFWPASLGGDNAAAQYQDLRLHPILPIIADNNTLQNIKTVELLLQARSLQALNSPRGISQVSLLQILNQGLVLLATQATQALTQALLLAPQATQALTLATQALTQASKRPHLQFIHGPDLMLLPQALPVAVVYLENLSARYVKNNVKMPRIRPQLTDGIYAP